MRLCVLARTYDGSARKDALRDIVGSGLGTSRNGPTKDRARLAGARLRGLSVVCFGACAFFGSTPDVLAQAGAVAPAAPPAEPVPAAAETAAADPSTDPENPEAVRSGRAHYEEGARLYEARRYREAIAEFRAAHDLLALGDLQFNIARCHEQLGEWREAAEAYRRYLVEAVDPSDARQVRALVETLEARAEEARAAQRSNPTSGTLVVESLEEGASLQIDGEAVGDLPTPPLVLPIGVHTLTVQRSAYAPFRASVQVSAGQNRVRVELQRLTSYRARRGSPLWTWVVGGLAVGTLGASIGLGIHAGSVNNPPGNRTARDFALGSDIALGAGIGLGLLATVLYFVESSSVGTERGSVAIFQERIAGQ